MDKDEQIKELQNELNKLKARLDKFEFSDRYIFTKNIQIMDGRKVQLGRSTGTTWGNSDEKQGWFGAFPKSQKPAPANPSISSVSGTGDDATINNNFTEIQTTLNGINTNLKSYGIFYGPV